MLGGYSLLRGVQTLLRYRCDTPLDAEGILPFFLRMPTLFCPATCDSLRRRGRINGSKLRLRSLHQPPLSRSPTKPRAQLLGLMGSTLGAVGCVGSPSSHWPCPPSRLAGQRRHRPHSKTLTQWQLRVHASMLLRQRLATHCCLFRHTNWGSAEPYPSRHIPISRRRGIDH